MKKKTSEQLPERRWKGRNTEVDIEGHCEKRRVSMEDQGGMEMSLQDPLPRTGRRRRKVRNCLLLDQIKIH